ncbi:MAG: acetate--CoA ligase family protein [Candidatus Moraniibacteriota bacterium]
MSISSLFRPESIVIIGASTTVGSVGNDLTHNILFGGYQGEVFLVNPKATKLFNRKCFSDVTEIEKTPDLAIIIVPAKVVPAVLRAVGVKGISSAVIISAGFKETGPLGALLETEIISIAEEFGISILGPNCLGYLSPSISLNASFASGKLMPKKGGIAFFSQSGALSTALLSLTEGELGFSLFASIGNKAMLKEKDFLDWARDDEQTKLVALYSEDIVSAETFIAGSRALLSLPAPKPLIVLKSGTTEAGTKASSSHTGSLAGSDAAYEALIRQSGAIRARSMNHLKNLLEGFSKNPPLTGNRIAIVTNAGGLGVLATDALVKNNLSLATLSAETQARLKEFLPPAASARNPIDVLGDAGADRYAHTLDTIGSDPSVDAIMVIVTPQSMTDAVGTARAIIHMREQCGKPVIAVFSGKDALKKGADILRKSSVALFTYPEEAAETLGSMYPFKIFRDEKSSTEFSFPDIDTTKAHDIIALARKEGRDRLTESEGYGVLAAYGFPILRSYEVHSASEAGAAALMIGAPVALKIISPDILHKSDAGGVMLHVTPENVSDAYDELLKTVSEKVPSARLDGAVIVEMAKPGGKEIILGMKHESGLGRLLMVGLGGIFVEVFKDTAFRFAPLNTENAEAMIRELKSYQLLAGARGQAGIDTDALAQCLGRLSRLVIDFPEISEIDINPLVVTENAKDFRILDARIMFAPNGRSAF